MKMITTIRNLYKKSVWVTHNT